MAHLFAAPSILAAIALTATAALAAGEEKLDADLSGYNETPASLSSPASADFRASINKEGTQIQYELSYSGFTTAVTQSHLHLGKRGTTGGIMVFLCSNLGNGPAGTPVCPTPAGTVSGTLMLDSPGVVVGPAAQGIAPGEFQKVIAAIRNGAAYANVHSAAFPAGEIRDQVKDFGHRHHD